MRRGGQGQAGPDLRRRHPAWDHLSVFERPLTLLPPRGAHIDLTEIRPIRPNQDVILPGVTLVGQGVKFEYRDRSSYRSRSGFSQTDGIAQFAGSFLRNSRRGDSADARGLGAFDLDGGFDRVGADRHQLSHTAPPSLFAGRNGGLGRYLGLSADEHSVSASALRPVSTSVAWNLSTSPVWRKTAPVTRKRAFGRTIYDEDDNGAASRRTFARRRRPAGRKPTVMLQNYMVTTDDDEEVVRANVMTMARARSRRITPELDRLVEQEAERDPTSLSGISQAYDAIFERPLRAIGDLSSCASEINADDNCADSDSVTESERLSVLGDELVNRSIEEVTDNIVRNFGFHEENNLRDDDKKKNDAGTDCG